MASSKAAVAEARRQKLLARGTERLQGILGEAPASSSGQKLAENPNQGRLPLPLFSIAFDLDPIENSHENALC